MGLSEKLRHCDTKILNDGVDHNSFVVKIKYTKHFFLTGNSITSAICAEVIIKLLLGQA